MPESNTPKFYIKTFGCQMNMDDSAELSRMLRGFGLEESGDIEQADLIHINTCSVRKKAEDKFFSFLGLQSIRKKKKKGLVIGVGGCTAELMDVREGHPEIDYAIGSKHPRDYAEMFGGLIEARFPGAAAAGAHAVSAGPVTAFQTVIRGCTNCCSYCVVPRARGPEASVPPERARLEAESRLADGAREIILLGQDVLAYGEDLRPRLHLLDVMRAVHDLDGLARLRFVTSHPRRIDEVFLRGLAEFPKVCEHFHIPFQSGDDEILRRMNRGYTRAEYIRKVELIREYFPGAGITADVIVGFPGETEEMFMNTRRLVEELRPDQLYAFKYSTRQGTRAADWADDVPRAVKEERLARLLALEDSISRSLNESLIGKTQEVMAAEAVSEGRYRGRTRSHRIADFTSGRPIELGGVVTVKITGATPHALQGERI